MKKNNLQQSIPILSLFLIFMIDFTFIISTHLSWDTSIKKYLPVKHHINTLENSLSQGHLWLEEAIAGDKYVDVEKDVMIPFQHAKFDAYVKRVDKILTEKNDKSYLVQLLNIDKKLHKFSLIAEERWNKSQIHGIGSDLDQKFDKEFTTIIAMIKNLSIEIDQRLDNEIQKNNEQFQWIIIFFLFINISMFYLLFKSKKTQQNYEASLHEEKEKAIVTLSSIGDAVVTTDINGNITFFNKVAEELSGYQNEEIFGLHIDKVLNLENIRTGKKIITPIQDVLHNNLTKLISNGTRLISRTGQVYIISDSAAPVKTKEGDTLGTVLVFQDDTSRHRIEEELRQSEAQYRSLINNVKEYYFFYAHDVDGIFQYLSNSVSDVLGYSKDEFMVHYSEYLTKDPINDRVQEYTNRSIKGEKQDPYILSIYTKDGDVRYLEMTEAPVTNEEGKVISIEGVAKDITQNYLAQKDLTKQKELLDYKAHYDALTTLPNRVLFLDRLTHSISIAKRNKKMTAVLFMDLDRFKEINDSFGHHVGDEVLKETALRLESQLRSSDTIARLGGDEFTIIVENFEDTSTIVNVINKLTKVMLEPIVVDNQQFYVTLSVGIAQYPGDGLKSSELLRNADAAMYQAKNDGRNTYCFYTQKMTEEAYKRVIMESSLRNALKGKDFIIHYQPQINAVNNKLIGMEALVRWEHPTMGLTSPDKFIHLAQEIGIIIELDQWVMRTAMTQLSQWYRDGLNPGVLALNITIKQLQEISFAELLSTMLKETGCKAEWIEVEIAEGQIMLNPENAIETLKRISSMGIEIAVDDFGTGYSSLSYLKRLPINKLKIDQSFVKDLPDDEEDIGIARAIVALAESLNLNVIAEGVETEAQRDFLVENGCHNIQGYLYSKPVSAENIKILLEEKFKN